MTQRTFRTTAGVLFALITLLHGLRLVSGWEVLVNGRLVSPLLSWVAVLLFGFLTYAAFRSTVSNDTR